MWGWWEVGSELFVEERASCVGGIRCPSLANRKSPFCLSYGTDLKLNRSSRAELGEGDENGDEASFAVGRSCYAIAGAVEFGYIGWCEIIRA